MNPVISQISENAVVLSVFLFAAAIFFAGLGWGAVAITRALQISIATNVTLARELSAIQTAIGKIPGGVKASGIPSIKTPPETQPTEGEFYPYDEELLYRQEQILELQKAGVKNAKDLSNEDLDKHLANARSDSAD
jgi:hypothetical protein